MNKFIGHLKIVTKHRHYVFINCCKAGIPWRGLIHDLSKYSPQEFFPSVKHFQGNRSPNEGEREDYGYSLAWMHHKGRNKHHFEYWRDLNVQTRQYEPVEMPLIYVKEMFCDRIAASKVYKGKDFDKTAPFRYFNLGSAAKKMHPNTALLLSSMLQAYAEKSDKEAFRYVRNLKQASQHKSL